VVSPLAGKALAGDAQIGEYFRVFVAHADIAAALVLHAWQQKRRDAAGWAEPGAREFGLLLHGRPRVGFQTTPLVVRGTAMLRVAVSFVLAAGFACVPAMVLAQPVTMDRLWPNEDGRSWIYSQTYQTFDIVPQLLNNQIRLLFDGPATAPNAIDAQYLRHELLSGPAVSSLLAGMDASPLMYQLWMARPDLRAGIVEALAGGSCPENGPVGAHSVFLSGEFAWRKTASEVAAWRCNLADTRSWQWLVSDLTIGSEFTLQLVPDLASNVFLHGTVGAVEPATVPAGSFANCVRVDYVVDYGETECTDEEGNPTGTSTAETRGWIRYAPDEGPVESFEEFIPFATVTGMCGGVTPGAAASRTTLRLASPSVPTRPATWGALKVRYH